MVTIFIYDDPTTYWKRQLIFYEIVCIILYFTLGPRKADNIFKCILLNENFQISN